MNCNYFGICGSCTLGGKTYKEQLNIKIQNEKSRFQNFWQSDVDIIQSDDGAFRNRAEFRIYKDFNENKKPTLFML